MQEAADGSRTRGWAQEGLAAGGERPMWGERWRERQRQRDAEREGNKGRRKQTGREIERGGPRQNKEREAITMRQSGQMG